MFNRGIGDVSSIFSDLGGNAALLIYLLLTGIILAGWRLFIYYREDRFFPKIEFFCDVLFKQALEDAWLVEIVCVVRNKGVAGHRVKDLNFRVHGLKAGDTLEDGDESINCQVRFPHLIRSGKWKVRPAMNVRVEPSTSQFYRHVASIDKEYSAVVVHGSMKYRQRWWGLWWHRVIHTCNRLVRVPGDLDEADRALNDSRLRLVYAGRETPYA